MRPRPSMSHAARVRRGAAFLLAACLLGAAPGCEESGAPADLTGRWGGDHIFLEVGSVEGNRIEYDCARGSIDEAFVTDADGRFDLRGEHVRERGGPIRQGEVPDAHPARYTGRVRGDTMTLTVTLTGTGDSVGTFRLVRGAEGRVLKCL